MPNGERSDNSPRSLTRTARLPFPFTKMTMLERMVKPNEQVSAAATSAVGGKRKTWEAGNGGGGGVTKTDARNLLHKLECKVRSDGVAGNTPDGYRAGHCWSVGRNQWTMLGPAVYYLLSTGSGGRPFFGGIRSYSYPAAMDAVEEGAGPGSSPSRDHSRQHSRNLLLQIEQEKELRCLKASTGPYRGREDKTVGGGVNMWLKARGASWPFISSADVRANQAAILYSGVQWNLLHEFPSRGGQVGNGCGGLFWF